MASFPRLIADTTLNFILPPRCMGCDAQTGSLGGLCVNCWNETRFIAAPQCECCGYPFELDYGEGIRCGACLSDPPSFDRARAAVAYDERIGKIIVRFKHSDRTNLAPGMAAWMRRVGAPLIKEADIIIPVPLHGHRLFQRRYNQSMMLAKLLLTKADKRLKPDLLRRSRATPSQGHLSPAARKRNVEGAFRVPPTSKPLLKGKRVLLIDDVLTTGATVNAIARRLKKDGARAVDVLTVARVVRPTAPPGLSEVLSENLGF